MTNLISEVSSEARRIRAEYRRRENNNLDELYAPWQPAESFIVAERKAEAASLLHLAGKFPVLGDQCLEVGFGKLGWLADLISWGVSETDLHGLELDERRVGIAKKILPAADLRTGDATSLPWTDDSFKFVIISTVFSSILDLSVRETIAREIDRVLMPGGVLLWYDLAVDNPRNKNVKGISKGELRKLFSNFDGVVKRITLAPPLARIVFPRSRSLGSVLSSIPFLRTHLIGSLVKN